MCPCPKIELLVILYFSLLCLFPLPLQTTASPKKIRIGVLVSSNNGKDQQLLESYKNAAEDALDSTVSWIYNDTVDDLQEGKSSTSRDMEVSTAWEDPGYCESSKALGKGVLLCKWGAEALIGPFCVESLKAVSLLGPIYEVSLVTWSPLFRSETQMKSAEKVISMYGAYEDYVGAVHVVLSHLKWNKIAIIYEKQYDLCSLIVDDALRLSMYQANKNTVVDIVSVSPSNITYMDDRLEEIKQKTRTTVLCMKHKTLEKFMAKADSMDMMSGYYGFLYLNFNPSPYNLTLTSSRKTRSSSRKILDTILIQFGQFPNLNHVEQIDDTSSNFNGSSSTPEMMPYFHDAVAFSIFLTHYKKVHLSEPKNFTASFLKTGPIHLDDLGMRIPTFSLVHHRDGNIVTLARVTSTLELLLEDSMSWIKTFLPISAFDCQSPYANCSSNRDLIAGVVSAVVVTIVILIIAIIVYKKYWKAKCVPETEWLVDDSEVLRKRLTTGTGNAFSNGTAPSGNQKRNLVRMETRMTLGLGSLSSLDKNMLYAPIANYRGIVVAIKHVRWTHTQLLKRAMIQSLTTVKELSHDNLNQFIGAHVANVRGESYVLFRYCAKGSLQDVLENDDIKVDWMFKLSFALDLARGMEYLHKSPLRSHGNLKSSNCVIDSRWVLKITDYGAITSYKKVGKDANVDEREFNISLLWTAPELLRIPKRPHKGTQKGDIYSFAIILQEILLRSGPFFHNNMEPDDIITLVKNSRNRRPYRPVMPPGHDNPDKAVQLMVSCWAEYADARPDFHNIRKRLLALNGAKRFNILDNMLSLLESHSSNLEQLVAERTEELEAEKRKTDSLLYQMLPSSVAEQLKCGQHVTPESFENVSIFFSDIVGFTSLASESKPLEVVDVLNDLYTCFDDIIARRDVYKVETIGDAYMVVSGCPMRNGERHTGEIANMALDLVSAVSNFKIRHRPNDKLNLRVGLHTGPCAAGVVGRTMPRYCLFGDTVNMASRMESTGKALHIHMSSKMNEALVNLDWGFLTVDRGFIDVKGKGLQKTFWLVGKENYKRPLPKAMLTLQNKAENMKSPVPSVCSLNVEDSMFSALRKTSITSSSITLENVPLDSEKGNSVYQNTTKSIGNDTNSPITRKKTLKRRFATAQTPTFSDDNVLANCESESSIAKVIGNTTGSRKDLKNNNNTPYKKDSACYSMSDHNSEPDLSRVENQFPVKQRINGYNSFHENRQSYIKSTKIDLANPLTQRNTSPNCNPEKNSDFRSVGGGNQNVHFPETVGTTTNTSSQNPQQSIISTTGNHSIDSDKNSNKLSSTHGISCVQNDVIPRIEIS